jgi:hypothetical protein
MLLGTGNMRVPQGVSFEVKTSEHPGVSFSVTYVGMELLHLHFHVSLNFEPWRKIMLLEAALHFADIAGSA